MGRFALLAALAMLGACAPAFNAPAEIRESVSERVRDAGLDPEAAFAAKGFVTRGYLTGHGAPDILIDYEAFPAGVYCGTGGCPLEIWVKDGAGPYRKAFDRQVLSHAIQSRNGRVWLAADVHHIHCSAPAATSCSYAFAWKDGGENGGYFAPAALGAAEASYASPLLQATPFDLDAAPIEVTSTIERFEHNCARARGDGDASEAVGYGPDLNGDGRREIVFDGRYATCRLRDGAPVKPVCFADTCGTIVFIAPSLPNAPWMKGFSRIEPVDFDYAFTAAGARMRLIAPCTAETCEVTPLTWSAASQRLE